MNSITDGTHNKERLRLALDAAAMGYWEWHPQTNRVIWDGQTTAIFGLAPGEFQGDFNSFLQLVHPEDRARLRGEINTAIEEGTEYHPEYRIRRPDGEIRWLASRGRAYYDDGGKVLTLLGVIRDITEQKQTEDALRASQSQLQLAQQAAHAGMWEWDLVKDKVQWSDQCFTVLGLAPGSCRPSFDFWMSLIHPEDRDATCHKIKEGIQTNSPLNLEYRVVSAGGGLRWVHVIGQPLNDSRQRGIRMLGLMMDVTARRQVESELRRAEQFNQTVLDAIPEHIFVLDRDGDIVSVNRAWRDFARNNSGGHLLEKMVIGANYLRICREAAGPNAEEADLMCDRIKDVLSGKLHHFSLEYPWHSPTQQRWYLMQISPLAHERGGAVISHLDITDRKQSEAERIRLLAEAQVARESAEAANRAKDEFIAQITHDLRSPLNAILGWTKVLRSRKVGEQTIMEALATIEQSAEKQKHMIEDLLDVSRIVTGKLRLDVRPVSLGEVIRSAMEVMRPACEAKEIECETELATDADAITGDPPRLEQVIWNIVSNAVKFTPSRGKVRVRLERADPHVRITISDTGKGIDPQHLPHIFNRYWQPADSDKRRAGGLGLGLSLARHVVELHGGTIQAESEGEGKGTKIMITLPYRAVRLQQSDQDATFSSTSSNGEIISTPQGRESTLGFEPSSPSAPLFSPSLGDVLVVVVDDEQDARELVAAILRQHNAEVLVAASASEALQIISESERLPDLLISDISMPEQDGYSLIHNVRSLPPNKGGQIPAIALTAYGRMEDRIRVLSAGFQMHVPKPVEPAELALIAANLTGRDIQYLNL